MSFAFIMIRPFTEQIFTNLFFFRLWFLRMSYIIQTNFRKVEFAVERMLEKYGYMNYGFLKILYRFQQGSFVHYFKRLNIDVKIPNITKTAQ